MGKSGAMTPETANHAQASLEELLTFVKIIEELLRFPRTGDHVDAAQRFALSISRNAPDERVELLGEQVASAIAEAQCKTQSEPGGDLAVHKAIWRLRLALEQAARPASDR